VGHCTEGCCARIAYAVCFQTRPCDILPPSLRTNEQLR
jgi:hypothetical protein